jgi:hypothetical protein
MNDAIREMQRKQATWHYDKAMGCMDAARSWRDKANDGHYVRESCLRPMRNEVKLARKHNHLSLRYRRGELTS